jgi:hypothetical protein
MPSPISSRSPHPLPPGGCESGVRTGRMRQNGSAGKSVCPWMDRAISASGRSASSAGPRRPLQGPSGQAATPPGHLQRFRSSPLAGLVAQGRVLAAPGLSIVRRRAACFRGDTRRPPLRGYASGTAFVRLCGWQVDAQVTRVGRGRAPEPKFRGPSSHCLARSSRCRSTGRTRTGAGAGSPGPAPGRACSRSRFRSRPA